MDEPIRASLILLYAMKFLKWRDCFVNYRLTDYIVIDTEDKKTFIKADLAQEIATMLGADYYQIDELKANYLTEIVQNKKAATI